MNKRMSVFLGGVLSTLLIAGVAWAAADSGPGPVSFDEIIEVPVTGVGHVTVEQGPAGLELTGVAEEPGWTATATSPGGRSVEVLFEGADGTVNVEVVNAASGVEVSVRRTSATGSSTSVTTAIPSTSSSTAASLTSSTSRASTSSTSTSQPGSTSTSQPGSTSTTAGNSTSTSQPGSTSTSQPGSTSTTVGDTTSTSIGSTSTTVDDPGVTIPDGTRTFDVGAAGSITVTVSSGRLSLDAVNANAGWSYEIDKNRSDDIEVEFESGDDEAEIRVRVDSSGLRVEIRQD